MLRWVLPVSGGLKLDKLKSAYSIPGAGTRLYMFLNGRGDE